MTENRVLPPILVYVCGKFRAPTIRERQANLQAAMNEADVLAHAGYVPIVPHVMIGTMLGQISEADAQAACLRLIDSCDGLCAMSGWEQSGFAPVEMDYAREHGKFVVQGAEGFPVRARG